MVFPRLVVRLALGIVGLWPLSPDPCGADEVTEWRSNGVNQILGAPTPNKTATPNIHDGGGGWGGDAVGDDVAREGDRTVLTEGEDMQGMNLAMESPEFPGFESDDGSGYSDHLALALLSAFGEPGASGLDASKILGSGAGPSRFLQFLSGTNLSKLMLGFPRNQNREPQLKRAVEHQTAKLTSSALTMCGRRSQDEDTVLVHGSIADSPYQIKAVFDGHGGVFASNFCAERISSYLSGMQMATTASLTQAFLNLDADLLQNPQAMMEGTTGVVALIKELTEPQELLVAGREVLWSQSATPLLSQLLEDEMSAFELSDSTIFSEGKKQAGTMGVAAPTTIRLGGEESPGFLITVANVGDSRATLLHADGGFTVLSMDHKPSNPEERRRIKRAGGFVSTFPGSVPRVDNILALSRAFGDGSLKQNKHLPPEEQRVVAVPDVHTFYAKPGDVLLMACDGVYEPEGMNWTFVSSFLGTLLHEVGDDLTDAAVKLADEAFRNDSGDNISVLLTQFGGSSKPTRQKARRFIVSADGTIMRNEGHSDADAAAGLEQQKGPLVETTEATVIL